MAKRSAFKKSGLNRFAREIGRLTAKTENATLEARNGMSKRLEEFRVRQERALKELSRLQQATRHALKEIEDLMRKATAEMQGAIRGYSRRKKSRLRILKRR